MKGTAAIELKRFNVIFPDGVILVGDTPEEALNLQKSFWDGDLSERDYLEKLRDRLLFLTGRLYNFKTAEEYFKILDSLGFAKTHVLFREESNNVQQVYPCGEG